MKEFGVERQTAYEHRAPARDRASLERARDSFARRSPLAERNHWPRQRMAAMPTPQEVARTKFDIAFGQKGPAKKVLSEQIFTPRVRKILVRGAGVILAVGTVAAFLY